LIWIDFISQAQSPRNFAPLILTFQPGQFVRFAQDFARLNPKIHRAHQLFYIKLAISLQEEKTPF